VDTTGRSGYLAKHVTVHSNDPVTRAVSLTVLVDVVGKPAQPGGMR
jgi:hypothetical protein